MPPQPLHQGHTATSVEAKKPDILKQVLYNPLSTSTPAELGSRDAFHRERLKKERRERRQYFFRLKPVLHSYVALPEVRRSQIRLSYIALSICCVGVILKWQGLIPIPHQPELLLDRLIYSSVFIAVAALLPSTTIFGLPFTLFLLTIARFLSLLSILIVVSYYKPLHLLLFSILQASIVIYSFLRLFPRAYRTLGDILFRVLTVIGYLYLAWLFW